MWISRRRILLFHTARNILAIFYALQLMLASCCRTQFDDTQSKALSCAIVIVGRISSLDYSSTSASIQVTSVLKQPSDGDIVRKSYIEVNGFLPSDNSLSKPPSSAQPPSLLSAYSNENLCISNVSISSEYILFINRTSHNGANVYHNVFTAVDHTKEEKKSVKNILCPNCASAPNAKAKRNLNVTYGAYNYKIKCRVTGSPLPNVRWIKDGRELDSSIKGLQVKYRRKKTQVHATLRIKTVTEDDEGLYQCMATNILGEDMAKAKLTVLPREIPKTTPPPPNSDDFSILVVDEDEDGKSGSSEDESQEPAVSHYIDCTGRDRDYCLHGGECRVFPDGRYKHCRCLAEFTGARCEQANVISAIPNSIPPEAGAVYQPGMELVHMTTALVTVLVVLVILLLILAFYCAGWRYSRYRSNRLTAEMKTSDLRSEVIQFLSDVEQGQGHKSTTKPSNPVPYPAPLKQCQTVSTQTEPEQTSLQQIRASLNLEEHFPHSASDVVLRRKSAGSSRRRPSSNPLEKRPTRSRLSATSTLTDHRKALDSSDIETVPERSASVDMDPVKPAQSHQDGSNSKPGLYKQAHCDTPDIDKSSLYISESSLNTSSPDTTINYPVIATSEKPTAQLYADGIRRFPLPNGSC